MCHDCPWDSHPPSDRRILTSTGSIIAFNNEPESISIIMVKGLTIYFSDDQIGQPKKEFYMEFYVTIDLM